MVDVASIDLPEIFLSGVRFCYCLNKYSYKKKKIIIAKLLIVIQYVANLQN